MLLCGRPEISLKICRVALWTSASESLIAHLHTDLIRSTILVADQGSVSHENNKTLDFIPCLSKYSVSKIPEGIVTGDLHSRFSIALHGMAQNLPRTNAAVMATFEDLDRTVDEIFRSKFKTYLPIGPLHLLFPKINNSTADPHGCIAWLDKQDAESVVYIAFGTVATPPSSELIALAEGLDETNVRFLWSLNNEKARSVLPPGFMDRAEQTGRGLFVSWAPQLEVLRHVAAGLFVGHGGCKKVRLAACRWFAGPFLVIIL
ncbi:hypothetical protein LUZ60_006079 [Juncus effusus]|nr:hypothetical protein LUZ60_006079 [Juncus effusus]